MLEAMLFAYKKEYKALKSYTIRVEKTSYIFHKVFLENDDNLIEIGVEDYGQDIGGILFHNKLSNKVYFALADYTFIEGARGIFEVLTSINREDFYNELRYIHKKIKWSWKKDIYRAKYIKLIYSLIEEYIRFFSEKDG